jgi:hypothetical protein
VVSKILIGMPSYDGRMHCATAQSLIHLASTVRKMGHEYAIQFVNHVMVDVARDALADMVLRDGKISHLVFLDSDVSFDRDTAERLIRVAFSLGHHNIVAGLYPRRGQVPPSFDNMYEAHDKLVADDDLLQVNAAPTGLMVIPRLVIESVAIDSRNFGDVYFNAFAQQDVHRMFSFGINEHGVMEGEDFRFCKRARRLGHNVYVVKGLTTTHEGYFKYRGTFNG